ncbi:MAG: 1-(5-phosphoribosyl)-5-[(5-phosphoribosylamino)methylideneamino]imidazole-4-carboxamide isomerase [Nitrospirota bacterium]
MIIFPAIDIKDGKVVRLFQGKFDEVTEYSGDPLVVAQNWQQKGAQWLHIVDLDGAKTGEMQNRAAIIAIAKKVSIPVQVGGGIRSREDVQRLIDGGVGRVILGTRVISDRDFLVEMLALWEKKIAVSLDCAEGFVAQRGWTESSKVKAIDFVKGLTGLDLACLIYTDIVRDGMLTGPDIVGLRALLSLTEIPIIASGGVATVEDLRKLMDLEPEGLLGAIIGKAIYEGRVNLEEAIRVCSRKE